jgi:predicted metal-dependent phosphoesterase TrpH
VISITDHDSTEGLAEALEAVGKFPNMELILGVELSTDVPGTEIHVLGYFIDYQDRGFQETLERFRNGRIIRARRMVDKLASMGIQVSWDRVVELAGDGAIGRPHIAQVLVEAGHVGEFGEAFDLYIGRNGPAYVEREKLTPAGAVRMINEINGVAVLAHPGTLLDVEGTLYELIAAGLVGMEVYYGNYSPEKVRMLEAIAADHGLVPCGGSDYHGPGVPDGVLPGEVGPPLEVVETLRSVWRERSRLRARTS